MDLGLSTDSVSLVLNNQSVTWANCSHATPHKQEFYDRVTEVFLSNEGNISTAAEQALKDHHIPINSNRTIHIFATSDGNLIVSPHKGSHETVTIQHQYASEIFEHARDSYNACHPRTSDSDSDIEYTPQSPTSSTGSSVGSRRSQPLPERRQPPRGDTLGRAAKRRQQPRHIGRARKDSSSSENSIGSPRRESRSASSGDSDDSNVDPFLGIRSFHRPGLLDDSDAESPKRSPAEDAQARFDALLNNYEKLISFFESTSAENDKLYNQLTKHYDKMAQLKDYYSNIADNREVLIQSLSKEIDKLRGDLSSLGKHYSSLTKQLAKTGEELKKLQEENRLLTKTHQAELEAKDEELERTKKKADESTSSLQIRIDSLEKALQAQEAALREAAKREAAQRAQLATADRAQRAAEAKVEEMKDALDAQGKHLVLSEARARELEKEYENLDKRLAELQRTIDAQQAHLSDAEAREAELRARLAESNRAKANSDAKLSETLQTLEDTERAKETAEKAKKTAEANLEKLREEFNLSDIPRLNARILELNERIVNHIKETDPSKQTELLLKQLEELRADNGKLQKDLKTLKTSSKSSISDDDDSEDRDGAQQVRLAQLTEDYNALLEDYNFLQKQDRKLMVTYGQKAAQKRIDEAYENIEIEREALNEQGRAIAKMGNTLKEIRDRLKGNPTAEGQAAYKALVEAVGDK